MNNTSAQSYFWLFLPQPPGVNPYRFEPWYWVEIDFDQKRAELCPSSRPSLDGFNVSDFWARLDELGVWQWKTWEEQTGSRFIYRAGVRFEHHFLTLRHGGRERRDIILDGHPERVAQLFKLVETIRRPNLARPNGLSLSLAPKRYNREHPWRSDIVHVATVDFERMEISMNKGESRSPRSIAGFDEQAFWRRIEQLGAWNWPELGDLNCCSWHRALQLKSQDVLTLSCDGVVREIPLTNQPERLDKVLELLAPLAVDSLVMTRWPTAFECAFPMFYRDELGVRAGFINVDGEAAYSLGKELDAAGFDQWVSDPSIPSANQRSWDGLEWEELENRLNRGLPFVRPQPPDIRRGYADKVKLLGPVPEALFSDEEELSFRWGVKFVRQGRCQIVEGVDRRIDLIKLLASHEYQATCSTPAYTHDYEDEYQAPLMPDHYMGTDVMGPAPVMTLQGESEGEIFSYEVLAGFSDTGLIDAKLVQRTQAICLLKSRRKCLETGTTWTFERPVGVSTLRSIVKNLETANAHNWQGVPGKENNRWSFRARVNGKVYDCGGVAVDRGGVESLEPDPRLAVLRKILHFTK
jgi:hypothetical protein